MQRHLTFISTLGKHAFGGGLRYQFFQIFLLVVMVFGAVAYIEQLRYGLQVTGMGDQVSWGLYIGNFTFLVGIAAAAVVLVVPAYIFGRRDMQKVVLLGECMAITAVVMSILFVTVDLGQPLRFWHAIPMLGRLNFPASVLAWDMLVLTAYLLLNCGLVYFSLLIKFQGGKLQADKLYPFLLLAIFMGLSIHTVTAFFLSGNPARPFWNTALLAPRFIASAFAAGSGLMILILQGLHKNRMLRLSKGVIRMLALIMAFALFINLFFFISEFFTHFYRHTMHGESARYLYFGLPGADGFIHWIYLVLLANLLATIILMVNPWRNNLRLLNFASILAFAAIWFEKGLALVVPGFIPTPLGEVVEYFPTSIEILVSLGIWAFGILLFTILVRATTAVESKLLQEPPQDGCA